MTGQVGPKFLSDRYGANTWPTSSMGNAERFVQIQVENIDSEFGWAHHAHLRVHVGTVHIDKATGIVDLSGKWADGFFVDTVSGRIRDHDSAQIVAILLHALAQMSKINVAVV